MNLNVLIDQIVRQTMVMIAQLSTSAGVRTPLTQLADKVFLDLTHELTAQGIGRKVIADMFGMTLRAYHLKVRRLTESKAQQGHTLWQAVFRYIDEHQPVQRRAISTRFRQEDSMAVGGILNDLIFSRVVTREGKGSTATYRTTALEQLSSQVSRDRESRAALVWLWLYRHGTMSRQTLADQFRNISLPNLQEALLELEQSQRIRRCIRDGQEWFNADTFVIPLTQEAGWESAILDHFQAVATNIAESARVLSAKGSLGEARGGSTFHIDLDDQHPKLPDVLSLLEQVRQQVSVLRQEVEATDHTPGEPVRVTFYLGQLVLSDASLAALAPKKDA